MFKKNMPMFAYIHNRWWCATSRNAKTQTTNEAIPDILGDFKIPSRCFFSQKEDMTGIEEDV